MRAKVLKFNSNGFLGTSKFVLGTILGCFLLGCSGHQTSQDQKTVLSDNGRAMHSIVVANSASSITFKAAKDLAEYLGRITGGDFRVTEADGIEGIAVGTYEDFPKLKLGHKFDTNNLTGRDEYLLRTHGKGVYLIGASDLAAQHAVWGFLNRLGYRQFFPTDTWEYIPSNPDLSITIDDFEKPDFYNRNGPRPAGYCDSKLWSRWHDRNRITSSFSLHTGHSYGGIIDRNKAIFEAHPEYLALVNGVRGGGQGDKFCIPNDSLRQLVIKDAELRIEADPDVICISMDPSDGGDWCECESCARMGSISDWVVILANKVATAINNMGYGEKYVGMYAYNQHSPPPSIDVHPNVIVSIATSFIRGGYTFEELVEGWAQHTNMLGIREYYGTFVWDQGLPRKGNGGSIKYLENKIPNYYKHGARFMNANSTDTWIGYGLGYYLSACLLWDIGSSDHSQELINDFLDKSFGKAQKPMRAFFQMINGDFGSPRTNEDLLARMYRDINEARELTDDPKVLARLEDMALYTRYVELFLKYKTMESGDVREKAAQDVYRHAYRMQSRMMSPVGQLYHYFRRSDVNVDIPEEVDPGHSSVGGPLEDMKPWKSSKLFTDDEINQFIANGVATYHLDEMGFEPITYSEDLEPVSGQLDLPEVVTGDMGSENSFRGQHTMFTWLQSDQKLNLDVTGGLFYQDRGNVRINLFSPKEALVEPVDADDSVKPDGKTHKVILKSPYGGLHTLTWMDGGAKTRLKWPEDRPMTLPATMEDPARIISNCRLYFYVPKGTKVVGGYTTSIGIRIFDGEGNSVLDMSNPGGGERFNVSGAGQYFSIPVPDEQDGTLWRMECTKGTVRLLTVPPYLARNEKELLLPKEVVEADKLN